MEERYKNLNHYLIISAMSIRLIRLSVNGLLEGIAHEIVEIRAKLIHCPLSQLSFRNTLFQIESIIFHRGAT